MPNYALTSTEFNSTELPDEVDFAHIVKQHHHLLLKVARSVVSHDSAEEVVQEAWVSIYENIHKFEGRSSLKTWMCRITLNKAITTLRKEKSTLNIFPKDKNEQQGEPSFYQRFDDRGGWKNPLASWVEDDPEKILASNELQECIEEVLSGIPKKQRLAFYLSHFSGEKNEEICNKLDISASNMKVLIHRARIKLFDHIANFRENGEC